MAGRYIPGGEKPWEGATTKTRVPMRRQATTWGCLDASWEGTFVALAASIALLFIESAILSRSNLLAGEYSRRAPFWLRDGAWEAPGLGQT
jgi:hypothetical protein